MATDSQFLLACDRELEAFRLVRVGFEIFVGVKNFLGQRIIHWGVNSGVHSIIEASTKMAKKAMH